MLSGLSKLRRSTYTSIFVNIELSYIRRIRMGQGGASDSGTAEALVGEEVPACPSYKLQAPPSLNAILFKPSWPGPDIPTEPSSVGKGKAAQNKEIQSASPKGVPTSMLWTLLSSNYLGIHPAELQSSCPGSGRDRDSHWSPPQNCPGGPGPTNHGAGSNNIRANYKELHK